MSTDPLYDCYRTLELPPSASFAQVRESYRVLSRVWHPDRFAGNPEMFERATARQQAINVAYQQLVAAYEAGLAPLTAAGADRAGPDTGPAARGAESAAARAAESAAAGRSTTPDVDTAVTPARSLYTLAAAWRERLRLMGPLRATLLVGAMIVTSAVAMLSLWVALASRNDVVRAADGRVVRAAALSVGGGHACAAAESRVYCWGDNHDGQAGADPGSEGASGTDIVRRAALLAMPGTVRALALGLTHSCALLDDGTAHCWGANHSAQLGDGTLDDRTDPRPVTAAAAFSQLTSLAQHTCATTVGGAVYCWGSDADGQLGVGAPVASCALDRLQFHCSDRPVRVAGSWQGVSAGGSHSCAVDSDGRVHCWGSNRHGQLGGRADERCAGPGGAQPCRRRPGVVEGVESATTVATGASHSCALDAAGLVVCWGMSTFGQTGPVTTPAPALIQAPLPFRALSAGAYHTCAIARDDSLWCWGHDGAGELRGAARDRCAGEPCARQPVRLIRSGVADVDAGFGRTCIRRTDDRIICWGHGELTLAGADDVAGRVSLLRSLRRVQAQIRWRLGSFARWVDQLGS